MGTFIHLHFFLTHKTNMIYKCQINQIKIYIQTNQNDNLGKFLYFDFLALSDNSALGLT